MSQLAVINKNGSITLYIDGKKAWKGPVANLGSYLTNAELPAPKPKKPKPVSRSQRWSDAASSAASALEELKEIQSEFEEWKDNLPENLQQSPLGEKLDAVCSIDLDSAIEVASEAENADLPLGFGRD